MSDEERRNLIREVEAGDTDALPKLQRLNDRLGLSTPDVEYLQEYFQLCEKFLNGEEDKSYFEERLQELNEQYKTQVGTKTLKSKLMGERLRQQYDEGWASSRNC
jgi:hypothetical protein